MVSDAFSASVGQLDLSDNAGFKISLRKNSSRSKNLFQPLLRLIWINSRGFEPCRLRGFVLHLTPNGSKNAQSLGQSD
jgi:hypothetical protein